MTLRNSRLTDKFGFTMCPCPCRWRDFTAYDALEGFTAAVLKNKGLPADTQLDVKRVSHTVFHWLFSRTITLNNMLLSILVTWLDRQGRPMLKGTHASVVLRSGVACMETRFSEHVPRRAWPVLLFVKCCVG
jgi:hypothetical protein